MENLLRRLTRQRDRLNDELQILEMQMGYRYMMALPLYEISLDLDALCQKVQDHIDKTRA